MAIMGAHAPEDGPHAHVSVMCAHALASLTLSPAAAETLYAGDGEGVRLLMRAMEANPTNEDVHHCAMLALAQVLEARAPPFGPGSIWRQLPSRALATLRTFPRCELAVRNTLLALTRGVGWEREEPNAGRVFARWCVAEGVLPFVLRVCGRRLGDAQVATCALSLLAELNQVVHADVDRQSSAVMESEPATSATVRMIGEVMVLHAAHGPVCHSALNALACTLTNAPSVEVSAVEGVIAPHGGALLAPGGSPGIVSAALIALYDSGIAGHLVSTELLALIGGLMRLHADSARVQTTGLMLLEQLLTDASVGGAQAGDAARAIAPALAAEAMAGVPGDEFVDRLGLSVLALAALCDAPEGGDEGLRGERAAAAAAAGRRALDAVLGVAHSGGENTRT